MANLFYEYGRFKDPKYIFVIIERRIFYIQYQKIIFTGNCKLKIVSKFYLYFLTSSFTKTFYKIIKKYNSPQLYSSNVLSWKIISVTLHIIFSRKVPILLGTYHLVFMLAKFQKIISYFLYFTLKK